MVQGMGVQKNFPPRRSRGSLPPILLVCLCLVATAAAQTERSSSPPNTGGFNSRLPSIPLRSPRPAQGDDDDSIWNTTPPDEVNGPVADFIDTLDSSDIAIEVVLGQSRLITAKMDIASRTGTAVIAVGDPSVVDFEVLPNPRVIRLVGKRAGVTDLSIITGDGQTYIFEVHVVYDLPLLRAQLRQLFPDTYLQLAQLREHLIVEGEARSPRQVSQILQAIEAYLSSVPVASAGGGGGSPAASNDDAQDQRKPPARNDGGEDSESADSSADDAGQEAPFPARDGFSTAEAQVESRGGGGGGGGAAPKVINLLRVPGVHQVMLQVRIAELDRKAVRQIGADILGVNPNTGTILGTQIGGASISAASLLGLGGLTGTATGATSSGTSIFGVFPTGDFEILLKALRRNSVLTILAEPNLMTMSGEEASFLAGGQFPVPVPQTGSGGGGGAITIEWKDFGVQLNFTPTVMSDGTIRLKVAPEVSSIDQALGTVIQGTAVPGVTTRKISTTVELKEGQTLVLAGLLQVEMEGDTTRIPLLGDLPYIGTMFSNTTSERVERELLVLVTPYLVSPMEPNEVPPLPGEGIKEPNDLEVYLLGRIEGRTGREHRSTTNWDDPLNCVEHMKLERRCVSGPVGFSE